MRPISLLTALLVAAVLFYWFELRHPSADEAPAPARAQGAASGAGPEVAAVDGAAEPAADAGDAPVPVIVLESQAQETNARLVLRGRTQARRQVEVAAETTGRVISEPLRHGAVVEEGQVLCRLDPGVRDAELAQAEAALAEADAASTAATQLQQRGYTAETAAKAERARLRAAQARLDAVRWDIERLEITAPFAGVLESDTAEMGLLLVPGSVCAEVVDLSEVKVEAYVSEQEVDRLSLGQQAGARLINGIEATGEVTFISRVADEETRTYEVEVTLPNPDRAIRAGMTAELTVALPPQTAHLVPQSALTLDDDGRLGVRVAEQGVARFHPVTILRDAPEGVWAAGLPDRADIIVVGQEFVRAGRRVSATRATAAAAEQIR
jgi:membrane fusion protein, multidrug efflux system